MWNKVKVLIMVAVTAVVTSPQTVKFQRYRTIEAYEVRPGILMLPRYSVDGLCELGLEKFHYTLKGVNLDSSLSRNEVLEIVDEIEPRGPEVNSFLSKLIVRGGHGIDTYLEYQNVTIQFFSKDVSQHEPSINNVAAVVTWKGRKCN